MGETNKQGQLTPTNMKETAERTADLSIVNPIKNKKTKKLSRRGKNNRRCSWIKVLPLFCVFFLIFSLRFVGHGKIHWEYEIILIGGQVGALFNIKFVNFISTISLFKFFPVLLKF
jgi:nitrate reductase NapE component